MSSPLAEIKQVQTSPKFVDLCDAKFDKNGIIDYYNPTLPQLCHVEEKGFLKLYAEHVRKIPKNDILHDAFKLCGKYFCTEMCGIFHAEKASLKLRVDGFQGTIPGTWPYWKAAFESLEYPEPRYIEPFKIGIKKKSVFQKIALVKKFFFLFAKSKTSNSASLGEGNFSYLPPTQNDLKNGIITADRLPLIITHSKQQSKPVVFFRFSSLFTHITAEDTKDLNFTIETDNLIEDVRKSFETHGITLNKNAERHLRSVQTQMLSLMYIHLKRLYSSEGNLPKTLWIGSCGDKWNSLLACAVQRNGGKVIAHDHAGVGIVHMPVQGFVESSTSDEFCTFTDEHAQSYMDDVQSWSLFGSPPTIMGLNDKDTIPYRKFPLVQKASKTIMYVTSIYERDRARIGPLPSDIMRADLQIRIIQLLLDQGHKVLFKPHPQSPVAPPDILKTLEDVNIIEDKPFQSVYGQANHLIFDYLHTSTFKEAIHTNLPITLIDLEDIQWSKQGAEMAKNRLGIVKVNFDQDNRAFDITSELASEIRAAEKKSNDKSFIQFFYGVDR